MSVHVLIVEDENLIRWSLVQKFKHMEYAVTEAVDGKSALERLDQSAFDLVMLDFRLPDMTGLDVLREMRRRGHDAVVILMTAFSNIENAVEAVKLGAFDYISKPFQMDFLVATVRKALETTKLKRELRDLRARLRHNFAFERVIARHESMTSVLDVVRQVARGDATTVFLRGETGTGKDLIAGVIHYNSDRAPRPFMNITCTAIAEQLLESELFGHERGAFTDARTQKKGLFELADGGTVFLDEVGDMVPRLQTKLLRFLEDREFRRVGGNTEINVDVRVITATNRDIEQAVKDGSFRQDLLFRLNVIPIELPPLRDRGADIILLADHFIARFATDFRKPVTGMTAPAADKLSQHSWPGNVRELRNVCERAVLLCRGNLLDADDFLVGRDAAAHDAVIESFDLPEEGLDLDELEHDLMEQAMKLAGGNQSHAAKLLNLSRYTFRYRLARHGLA
ncbi:MAG: sigma-54-dependent Fis family transcriptional regulator [Phycisphaerales bacterium]|nr:sigma-54-dependent Fis family transcriptional regulator [Phycisphaerales bacterium]